MEKLTDLPTHRLGKRELAIRILLALIVFVCTLIGTALSFGRKVSSGLGILVVPKANRVLCHCISFRLKPT